MRRTVLTTLVLLPVTALAHAATSNEPQPSSSSVNVSAALKTPAATLTSMNATHAAIHETITTTMIDNFTDAALQKGGTLEYVFLGSVPQQVSAPAVTRAVEVGLTNEELATQPAVTNVIVRATVDEYGFPRDLTIAKSAGALIDQKVLAAVGQYRFKPAMLDNRAVGSSVTISVKIAKP